MSVEQFVERQLAGEAEVGGETLPLCHFGLTWDRTGAAEGVK